MNSITDIEYLLRNLYVKALQNDEFCGALCISTDFVDFDYQ